MIFRVASGKVTRGKASRLLCRLASFALSILMWAGIVLMSLPAAAETPLTKIIIQQGAAGGTSAFSPDGRTVVTSDGRTAVIWDVSTGRELRRLDGNGQQVKSVAFSPDGRTVLTGITTPITTDKEGFVVRAAGDLGVITKLWDAATGSELRQFKGGWSIVFSPDGKKALLTGAGACLVDLASGSQLRCFETPDPIHSIAISLDGRTILTGGDKIARLWDVETGRELQRFTGHTDALNTVAISSDGRMVLTAGHDHTARLWDIASGRELRRFELPDPVSSAAFSLDGATVLTGSWFSHTAQVWDAKTGLELHKFEGTGPEEEGLFVTFSPDGRTALTGTQLWNVASWTKVREFKDNRQKLSSIALSKDGRAFLTGSKANAARLWDASTGQSLRQLAMHSVGARSVAFSPDGKTILTGDDDKSAWLWDAASGRELKQFKTPGVVQSLAFSPDGRRVLTDSNYSDAVQLWDVASGRQLQFFKHPPGTHPTSVAFSPDGRTIFTGCLDPNARLWDVATGRELRRVQPATLFEPVAFSPDGRTIATGDTDGVAQLWDATTGRALRQFVAHDRLTSVAFSPDGRTVVTGSYDQTAQLWDVANGKELHRLQGHQDIVNSVVMSADGRVLTASEDGTVRIWDASSGAERATIIPFADGEWLTVTPEGFFDVSSSKAAENLNVVRGFDVYSIDQFRDALFRPDLVKAKLAGDPNGLVKAAAEKLDLNKVVDSGNAPRVAITSPGDGSTGTSGNEINVEATVTAQGGGIGRIEWRLNGQPVGIDTRGLGRVEKGAASTSSSVIKIAQKMVLDAGDNVVEVLSYNTKGLVASQPSRITIKAAGPVAVIKPRLFVLAVGVNDYYDGRLKLNFAVPDARAMAATFEKAGAGLFQSVKAVTVLDADVTRSSLEKVFAQLASEVKTTDVFVFYVAGHGRTLNGHYYFLPQDFRYRDEGSYAENGLSQEQWQKWITMVQARKSVLIYDTCESGSVAADNVVVASNTRGVQRIEEQAVAYQKLRDATGKTILAASTDTQPALEGYRGHGVFSYVVMEALAKAQTNANGLIEVTGLISYVDDKVPDVSFEAFHQRQIPQNKMLGSNFAIARPVAMPVGGEQGKTNERNGATSAPNGPSADAAISAKPTHVVIAPADVFERLAGQGAKLAHLAPGTLLTLVKTEQGWVLVAKDGKSLGYVAENQLVKVQ